MIHTGRTQHASAVLLETTGLLIRGPSGVGKSRLVLALLDCAARGRVRLARLVGDDRVIAAVAGGRVVVSPVPTLAGLIEVRGLGLLALEHEPLAKLDLIVDLAAADGARMPEPAAFSTTLLGVAIPRLPVAPGADPLPLVLAALETGAPMRQLDRPDAGAPGSCLHAAARQ